MRKQRKSVKLVAVLAGVSLIAAACGDDDDGETTTDEGTAATTAGGGGTDTTAGGTDTTAGGTDTTGGGTDTTAGGGAAPQGGTITYGTAQEFNSLNNNLADTNSVKNGIVASAVLPDALPFSGAEGGAPVLDAEFLDSAEIVSEDPQTIEYVINADAAWSDGDPIDCDDFYLQWIAQNAQLPQLDRNGEPAVDETGAEILLFAPAGTTGFEDIGEVTCSEDGKTVTTTYDTPFADWNTLFTNMVPAHVVEREAGVDDLVAAYDGEVRADLEAVAEAWKTVFTPDPGTVPEDIFVSGGPFIIDTWAPGESLTLVRNDAYWGTPANVDSIVIRLVAEEAQAQALANAEIDLMDPQPSPDLLTNLEGLDGVTVQTGSQFLWEHFDFNFRPGGPFEQFEVRQAFAKCLPREQMLTNLIRPIAPDAELLNNRWIQDFEEGYEDTSGGEYDAQDIAGATTLLEGSGLELPVQVRLGWNLDTGNQRRVDQVAATKQACDQAGFEIIDAGDPAFFEGVLDAGEEWDVAMFGWFGSPAKTGSVSNYVKGGGNNNGRYSNPQVDELSAQLTASLDPAEVRDLANQIDTILWDDLATVPLYSQPAVGAWRDTVQNIVPNPSQNGITWNAEEWAVTS